MGSQAVTIVTSRITKGQCTVVALWCFDLPAGRPYDETQPRHIREAAGMGKPDDAGFMTEKREQGFTLVELMIALAVIMIVLAIAVPPMINTVNDISLRYSASELSSLLQSARIQAVKSNSSYTVQSGALPNGQATYFIDLPKTGAYVVGDPFLPMSSSVTLHAGTGSGAPNEGVFLGSLNFAIDPGTSQPSFNARGCPCVVVGNACPQTPGQGLVIFLSKSVLTGNVPWAAVVVTPSGRIQVWTCDSAGNWVQRD